MQSAVNDGFPMGDLIEVKNGYNHGSVTLVELTKRIDAKTKECMEFQSKAGIDIISDGLYNWDDLLQPFTRGGLKGVETDGLMRFFDNNAYYRKPLIKGKISFEYSSTLQFWKRSLRFGGAGKLRGFIPGPLTFARLCENRYYSSFATLLDDLAVALRAELDTIVGLGLKGVQVCDPAIGFATPGNLEKLLPPYSKFTADIGQKLWFTIPYSRPNPLVLRVLSQLNPASVSIDVSSTTLHGGSNVKDWEGWIRIISDLFKEIDPYARGMPLSLGLIDCRNTLLERKGDIKRAISLARKNNLKVCSISNNGSLDLLPESVGRKKVTILGAAEEMNSQ